MGPNLLRTLSPNSFAGLTTGFSQMWLYANELDQARRGGRNKVVPIGSFPACGHLLELKIMLVNSELGICSATSESDLVMVAQLHIKFRIWLRNSPSDHPGVDSSSPKI